MNPLIFAPIAAGIAIPALALLLRYRREMKAARARLAAVERHVISTQWGAIEYAERGSRDVGTEGVGPVNDGPSGSGGSERVRYVPR